LNTELQIVTISCLSKSFTICALLVVVEVALTVTVTESPGLQVKPPMSEKDWIGRGKHSYHAEAAWASYTQSIGKDGPRDLS
jgi:hypothetical protein